MKEIPAVSVIIPMYNTEKYVAECLDSVLAQTFQDFEVIVVDDCSTDDSVKVVKSYMPKFGGRLNISVLKKKSNGGGSIPRNRGLELSRGKYVFFLDSDDAITPTAFEKLHKIAENFNADVVHCEKFYRVPDNIWHDAQKRRQLKADNHFTHQSLNVTQPVLLSTDIAKRVQLFASKKLPWNFWLQFVRRNFLIENEIRLPDAAAQDMLFTMCELCCAQNYVIVPNVVNFYRVRDNSVSTENISDVVQFRKWFNTVKLSIRYLDGFMNKIDVLAKRPDLKYALFNTLTEQMLDGLARLYAKIPSYAFDDFLRKEFADGDNLALTTFVFNSMNVQRLLLQKNQREFARFNAFAAAAQKRIAELEAELNRLNRKE